MSTLWEITRRKFRPDSNPRNFTKNLSAIQSVWRHRDFSAAIARIYEARLAGGSMASRHKGHTLFISFDIFPMSNLSLSCFLAVSLSISSTTEWFTGSPNFSRRIESTAYSEIFPNELM
ncbi:hypothetical protein [Massilia aquatica]|uniref:Uncharacterized protein n=1 Tax=Massilia aquatica TaxID=2609000 RepID=A0ABX0M290_9BURK|nr:hypothetical protein [Massilia aquatica]NHZ41279.1 hypothetical protein [Massilia aquatica]